MTQLPTADQERIERFTEALAQEIAASARKGEVGLGALEVFERLPKAVQKRILHVTSIQVMFALEQTPGVKRNL